MNKICLKSIVKTKFIKSINMNLGILTYRIYIFEIIILFIVYYCIVKIQYNWALYINNSLLFF